MKIRRLPTITWLAPLALAIAAWVAVAEETPSVLDVDKKIIENMKEHSEIMHNLEYLCDMIGPRLTGSDRLKRANEWTRQRLVEYGCENAHLESYSFGRSWTRGPASGRIVEPNGLPLTMAAQGWTPGTDGTVRGELVYVEAKTLEDLEKYRGKLRGQFIITAPPVDLSRVPDPGERSPANPPSGPEPRRGDRTPPAAQAPSQPNPAAPANQEPGPPGEAQGPRDFAGFRQMQQKRVEFYKKEGVLVAIRDSAKEHSLLNISGAGARDPKDVAIPSVSVTHENYAMLWRLLQRKIPVVLEMNINNTFSEQSVDAYNTVAEIRGYEKPDEVVILGAHLDSWDLGTGATDNGTGSMAVLEAARVLKAVGARPRRTIRFVLFSGEEEGLLGSRAYVKAHKDELSKISAVLVMDIGTGRIKGISLQGRDDIRPIMAQVLAPLNDMGVRELRLRGQGGTDHASFISEGVPGFAFYQEMAEYRKTHHSQSDTFDKALKDDLLQAATVLAVAAYNIAELPEMLPRRPAPARAPSPGPVTATNPTEQNR
jgi:3-dehydroquinate dehydratase